MAVSEELVQKSGVWFIFWHCSTTEWHVRLTDGRYRSYAGLVDTNTDFIKASFSGLPDVAFQACRSLFVNGDIEVCIDDTASEGHFAFLSAVDQFRVPLHVTSDPELLVMLLNKTFEHVILHGCSLTEESVSVLRERKAKDEIYAKLNEQAIDHSRQTAIALSPSVGHRMPGRNKRSKKLPPVAPKRRPGESLVKPGTKPRRLGPQFDDDDSDDDSAKP